MSESSSQLLVGRDAIMAYCSLSRAAFYKFVELGLPARIIDGRWYAHPVNLDRFLVTITGVSMKNVTLEELEASE